jgi:hypothetical protein
VHAVEDSVAATIQLGVAAASDMLHGDSMDMPFADYGLSADAGAGATNLRLFPLWLISDYDVQLVVWAHAGARAVVVETLGPRDSSLVDLQARRDTLWLWAVDAGGDSVGMVKRLLPDSLRRVAFP